MTDSPPPHKPAFRADIEGLRGLAILMVVVFHAGVAGVSGAFVAVDVFFVISGFFLTSSLVREIANERQLNLTAFYARRMARLLPVLVVVLLATLAMAMFLYAPIDRASVAAYTRPVAFFAGNIAFAAEGVNYFSATENPLLHTWSLGVEQQFHLIWPVVLIFCAWLSGRNRVDRAMTHEGRVAVVRSMLIGILVAGAVSFAISALVSRSTPMWAYFGPHTRLWEFALGGAAAMLTGGRNSLFGTNARNVALAQLIGLVMIGVSALLFDRSMPYPGAIALLPVLGAVLLLASGDVGPTTVVGRALSIQPLQFLGRVSYAWYLWHWPLMVLGATLLPDIGVPGRLAWGVIALALATITHRLVEQPIRDGVLKSRSADWVFYGATVVSALVLLIGHVAAIRSEHFVNNSVHRVFAAARDDHMQHGCWVRSVDALPGSPCLLGDKQSRTRFVLLGDSHAEHWLGGLDRAGRERGWSIEADVMGGCPVANFSGLTSRPGTRRYQECTRYREAMLSRIIAQRPSAVILSSYDHYVEGAGGERSDYQVSASAWQTGLRRTYSRLAEAGITTVVIRGTPRTGFDVPSCLSRREAQLAFARRCTYELDRQFITQARRAQDEAASGLPIRFVDMNDQICSSPSCETMRDGVVIFTDDNHLTATFTRSLAGVLGSRLAQAVNGPVIATTMVEQRAVVQTRSLKLR